MNMLNPYFSFGDIILMNFPFSDYSAWKKRPCLVLRRQGEDILVCFISSQLDQKEEMDFFLKKNRKNHLAADSIIRLSKIVTIHVKLIDQKLGELSSHEKQEVKKRLIALIQSL